MNGSPELARSRALVKSQDNTAQTLRSELAACRVKLMDYEAQISLMRQARNQASAVPPPDPRIPALEAAMRNALLRVADLAGSLSWRITAPLRALGKRSSKQ